MKKALIIGFVGRLNSGDEMMLEMHRHLLAKLGFSQIDVTTEWPEDVVSGYRYPIKKNLPQPDPYDLILIGGGALGPGYGFFSALYYKFNFGAKLIMSSVNLDSRNEKYLSIMREAFDLIILRSAHQYHLFKKDLPQLLFLPDVSTIYQPKLPGIRKSKIAIVVRDHSKPIIQFSPCEPFDVLILSRTDYAISKRYAEKHGGTTVDVSDELPQRHADLIASYGRVLSAGRFHAALYAIRAGCDFVYWPARARKGTPDAVINQAGKLSWDEIKILGGKNLSLTKAGLTQDQWAKYGAATEKQYLDEFRRILERTTN